MTATSVPATSTWENRRNYAAMAIFDSKRASRPSFVLLVSYGTQQVNTAFADLSISNGKTETGAVATAAWFYYH